MDWPCGPEPGRKPEGSADAFGDARGDEPRQTEFDLQGLLSVGTPISTACWRAVSLLQAVAARSRIEPLVSPLILSCSPANNELKPGQRQPLPKSAAGVKRQALTPGPGFLRIIVNAEFDRAPPEGWSARTFGGLAGLARPR